MGAEMVEERACPTETEGEEQKLEDGHRSFFSLIEDCLSAESTQNAETIERE